MKIIRQGVVRGVTVGLSLLMFAGCDDFLDVDNPGSLLDEDLERPELLATLANTPEANIAGTMSSLNTRSGLLSDELFHPRTQQENIDAMAGNRLASSSAVEGHWRSLSQSRFLSDEVASRLLSAGGTPSDIARAYFFAGTARMAMADHFNVIVYDHEDTPKGPITVINDAITAFTQSASHGTGNVKAAALGQIARAYRSLYFEEKHLRGNTDASLFSQAESFAQQALAADSDYNLSLRYGSPGGDNGQYSLGSIGTGSNLIDSIYIRLADPVTGIWDPRIPHEDEDIVEVNGITVFDLKYHASNSPLPLSRAAEARLIIAEARILVGDLAGAVSMINENRAAARSRVSASDWGGGTARGWPPASPISDLSDFVSTDATEVYDQLKHERRAEFFVELRRWPDMRYYEIFPYRWLSTNVAAGVHLRWPVAPEEIATNENLSLAQTKVVYVN
jgi:hypothetical protein